MRIYKEMHLITSHSTAIANQEGIDGITRSFIGDVIEFLATFFSVEREFITQNKFGPDDCYVTSVH